MPLADRERDQGPVNGRRPAHSPAAAAAIASSRSLGSRMRVWNKRRRAHGNDLGAWQSAFGQTVAGLAADGDRDGDVDGADLLFRQRQLSGGDADLLTAPEPAGFGLATVELFAAMSRVRRLVLGAAGLQGMARG
jgi:hypothetical protein